MLMTEIPLEIANIEIHETPLIVIHLKNGHSFESILNDHCLEKLDKLLENPSPTLEIESYNPNHGLLSAGKVHIPVHLEYI